MRRIKTRKASISTKLTIGIALFSTLVCLCLGGAIYLKVYSYFIENVRMQCMDAAAVAVEGIDQGILLQIEMGDEDTKEYGLVVEQLRESLASQHIEYIYIMRAGESGVPEFWVDADEEEPAAIGDEYDDAGDELLACFQGECTADTEPTSDEWGTYISGYAPIFDENQNVIGIVGIDNDINFIMDNMRSILMTILFIALGGVIFICIGNALIVRSTTGKIKKIIYKIDDVVHSNGDLTQELSVKSGDEMELIASLLNEFLAQLRQILGETQRLTENVKKGSSNAAKKLRESQGDIDAVSGAMQEMGCMMNETATSMERIQEAAIRVTQTAEKMVVSTQEGCDYMENAKNRASGIRSKALDTQHEATNIATQMTNTVNQKIEQAQAVSSIAALSQTIIAISKQSNLLAINASIEAARAGESGRGFAVVAEEISSLATTSKTAAEEIGKVCSGAISSVNELADATKDILSFVTERVYKDYNEFVENGTRYYDDAVRMRTYMEDFSHKAEELNKAVFVTQEAISNISAAIQEGNASVLTVADTSMRLKDEMNEVMDAADTNETEIVRLKGSIAKFII